MCCNPCCDAFCEQVIANQEFQGFDLANPNHGARCPICQMTITPETVGFNNCLWKVTAVKAESPAAIYRSAWRRAGNDYTTYEESVAGIASFRRLQIVVRPLPNALQGGPTNGQRECPICLENLGIQNLAEFRSGCGHWFHRDCLARWEASRHGASCPMCRSEAPEAVSALNDRGWPVWAN